MLAGPRVGLVGKIQSHQFIPRWAARPTCWRGAEGTIGTPMRLHAKQGWVVRVGPLCGLTRVREQKRLPRGSTLMQVP